MMDIKEIIGLLFMTSLSIGVFVQIFMVLQLSKMVYFLGKQADSLSCLIFNMECFKIHSANKEIDIKKKQTEDQRLRASQKKKEWWAKKKASEAATPETSKTSD